MMMSKINCGGFKIMSVIHTCIMFPFDLHPFKVIFILQRRKLSSLLGAGQ